MSIKREILTGIGLALTILLLVFLVQDASAHSRHKGKATKAVKAVKAWKHAKSPLPIHPISHKRDGTLKLGSATAYGD